MTFNIVDVVVVVFVCDDICIDNLDVFLSVAMMMKLGSILVALLLLHDCVDF